LRGSLPVPIERDRHWQANKLLSADAAEVRGGNWNKAGIVMD
jgi:hypothetical protein